MVRYFPILVVLLSATATLASPVISDRNVPIEPGTKREVYAEGLEHPWSMAWMPDGTLLVTERPGRLRIVHNGKVDPKPIEGVPPVFAENQGGLLDISLHPRFAENRLIYLTYAHGTTQENWTRVARARLWEGRLENLQVIFEVNKAKPNAQHFGSRLAWMADGTLLVSIGDGGNPPTMLEGRFIREQAQNPGSHLGKIIRIKDDGSSPTDNPKFGSGALPELWSIGHRNVQGMVVDRQRNSIWVNEHGALGGDELNRLSGGQNFGWPAVSQTRDYRTGEAISAGTQRGGMQSPELLWEVSVAPSGLMLYDGKAFPKWQGDLFSGSLVSLDVRKLDLDDQGRILKETALRVGQRVRDVRQGPDGFVYVLTDERAGRILRFVPDSVGASAPAALPNHNEDPGLSKLTR